MAYLRERTRDPAAYNAASRERKKLFRERHPNSNREYYARNIEKERARKQLELQTRGEEIRARNRARYAAHRTWYRAIYNAWAIEHRESLRAAGRKHYQNHKPYYFEKGRKRRALKALRTVVLFTLDELNARMSVFGHCCAYCGGPFEHIDHVIPLARGGSHCLANLRPACRACNLRKAAKPPRVWFSEVAYNECIHRTDGARSLRSSPRIIC